MTNMWRSAKQLNQKLFPQFESLKQGRLSKVFDLYRDYKQAFVDIFEYMKVKPVRVGIQVTIAGLTVYANIYNPDFDSYKEQLLDSSNRHSLISDLIRNKDSNCEVKRLMKYYSEGRLLRFNFGLFSTIMLQEHSTYNNSYEKNCSTIQSRLLYFDDWKQRIVDVGFLDRWYMLDTIMVEFDVNEQEFL